MRSNYWKWSDRARFFLSFVLLPSNVVRRNKSDLIRALGFVLTFPWFVLTSPITFLVILPGVIICMWLALTHIYD